MADKPDTRTMTTLIEGADHAVAVAAERAAVLAGASASAIGREAARVTWRRGRASVGAREATARADLERVLADEARASAERAAAPWDRPGVDQAVLHGRVVDRRGAGIAGLRVVVTGPEGKPAAEETTADTGYYRLELAGGAARSSTASATGSATDQSRDVMVRLSVFADRKELHRDKVDVALTPGHAFYREIAVEL